VPKRPAIRITCPYCGKEGYLVKRKHGRKYWLYVRHVEEDGRRYEHVVGSETNFDSVPILKGEWTRPAKVVRYYGGDSPFIAFLKQLLPEHIVYVEVFAGGASLLLSKPPSPVEVYNDINSRITNLYMCIAKTKCLLKLIDLVRYMPISKELWEYARRRELEVAVPVDSMPDPVEAFYTLLARFWGYGGTLRTFNAVDLWGGKTPHVRYWDTLVSKLRGLSGRLRRVIFECDDWRRILTRYDKPYVFFYLDPPHHNARNEYDGPNVPEWTKKDFLELLDALSALKGRWLLKYTWDPEVEEEVARRGYNYVVVEYFSNFVKDRGYYYVFATNFPLGGIPQPAGAVKAVLKVVSGDSVLYNEERLLNVEKYNADANGRSDRKEAAKAGGEGAKRNSRKRAPGRGSHP